MLKNPNLALALLCALVPASTNAAAFFSDRAARAQSDTARLTRAPEQYRALSADFTALKQHLASASSALPVTLSLPMPDGSTMQFEVFETSNMAPELQAQFPDVKSYRGTLLDADKAQRNWVSARLDVTQHGFSAMVFDQDRVVMLEPVQIGTGSAYLAYDRAQVGRVASNFSCGVTSDASAEIASKSLWTRTALTPKFSTGATLRTYRLALATTGEYSAIFGGTIGGSIAAINTAMNRVNEIYQREFALRMVLIADNANLIFLDGATDPYTNNSGGAMLTQNQNTLDTVVGNANYDIGHVFSTGGGGVATLNSPCGTGVKARGVTGLGNPIGDPFYVDYVAHEMGHQWGGPHTFNGTSGSCSGGNRSAGFAYEPGSGSTIQAYAGICAPQDLQPNSDPWFHTSSLLSIQTFLNGAGGSCGTTAPSGNQTPIANAGVDRTIPARTPFSLTATGTDPEGRPLLYLFEQYNLGPAAAPDIDNGQSPITRSFNPTSSATRTFPARRANGSAFLGEILPQVARSNFQFRLTVRDQASNGGLNIGATDSDDVSLVVVDTGAPFAVSSQNTAGTIWPSLSSQTITWDVAGTTAAPISCANVEIALSFNGGLSFTQVLMASTPNDGSESITAPNRTSSTARVRVRCADNVFFDVNDANIQTQHELFANGFED